MEITNQVAFVSMPVLNKIIQVADVQNSPIRVRHWVPKIGKRILEIVKGYEETLRTLALKDDEGNVIPAKRRIAKDGEGNIIPEHLIDEMGVEYTEVEDPNSFTIPPENMSQVEELLQETNTVDFKPFTLDELKDLPITSMELDAISWLISE